MSVWPIKVLYSAGVFIFCQPRIMIFKMKRQKNNCKEKTIMCKKKNVLEIQYQPTYQCFPPLEVICNE